MRVEMPQTGVLKGVETLYLLYCRIFHRQLDRSYNVFSRQIGAYSAVSSNRNCARKFVAMPRGSRYRRGAVSLHIPLNQANQFRKESIVSSPGPKTEYHPQNSRNHTGRNDDFRSKGFHQRGACLYLFPFPNASERSAQRRRAADGSPSRRVSRASGEDNSGNWYCCNSGRRLTRYRCALATCAATRGGWKCNASWESHPTANCANPLLVMPPPRTKVQETIPGFQDSLTRMIEEIFWFWPEQSASDAALVAIESGHIEVAAEIWKARAQNQNDGCISVHRSRCSRSPPGAGPGSVGVTGTMSVVQAREVGKSYCANR